MTKHFKPAFRQEVAELVLDKGYSIREAKSEILGTVYLSPLGFGPGFFFQLIDEASYVTGLIK